MRFGKCYLIPLASLQPSWFENYPTFYRSRPCEMFKAFVRSITFANIVAFVLIINLVAVVIETTVRLATILYIHVDGLLIRDVCG